MTWTPITCAQADALLDSNGTRYDGWGVISSLTDMGGTYGPPEISTTWWWSAGRLAVKTVRHPRYPDDPGPGDRSPCEHWQGDTTTPEVRDALGLHDEETTTP